MASKKKVRRKARPRTRVYDEKAMYRDFLGELTSGTLGVCVRLHETRNASGQLEFEYDEEVDDP